MWLYFLVSSVILAKLNHSSIVAKYGRALVSFCLYVMRNSLAWVSAAGSPKESSNIFSKFSHVPQSVARWSCRCWLLAQILTSFDPHIHDSVNAILHSSSGN